LKDSPTGKVLQTGEYAVSNDAQNDPGLQQFHEGLKRNGINSTIAFPIKKMNRLVGVFSLSSHVKDFFDDAELNLLKEAAGDISFALDVFEKEKWRREAEDEVKTLNHNLEVTVKERTSELEMLNKDLEAFSYSVSHDLRAPLRGIGSYASILKEDYQHLLDGEPNRLLRIINESVCTMTAQIEGLLSFSKLGRKELNKTTVDMNQLVENSLAEIKKTIDYKAIITIEKLQPAKADPFLMEHVMVNLLSNAIKYSANKENPHVTVNCEQESNEIIYSIKDNGVGFNMDYADKLFGVFQRLHSSTKFEGTGVGLAIVQRIIHKHGGKIWAESKEGEGATFYFTLHTGD
jgi:light-regulated signal transduction histidine kinase (bacteriophytochrome)